MFHYNAHLREAKPITGLLTDLVMPQVYLSTSAADFLNNKQDIKTTKTLLPPGVLFLLGALIQFQEPLTYRRGPPAKNCAGAPLHIAELSDVTGSVRASVQMTAQHENGLQDGMRLYKAIIIHIPRFKLNIFRHYETCGPETPEEAPDGQLEAILKHAFA